MYEMEGTPPGRAAPGRPVARPPRCCGPPARARHPREAPVPRLHPRPGSPPGDARFQR